MPVIEFRHNSKQIIIRIGILPPALDPAPNRVVELRALIDTGASLSGIPISTARELTLPLRAKELITTPGGDYLARLFQFRIGIYQNDVAPMPHVLEPEFIGIEFKPGRDFDALLGMDVLGAGDLRISRDGNGSFAFA